MKNNESIEAKAKDILFRRGALHVFDGHRFYLEDGVLFALKEALSNSDDSDKLQETLDIVLSNADYEITELTKQVTEIKLELSTLQDRFVMEMSLNKNNK